MDALSHADAAPDHPWVAVLRWPKGTGSSRESSSRSRNQGAPGRRCLVVMGRERIRAVAIAAPRARGIAGTSHSTSAHGAGLRQHDTGDVQI
jgi:hypothetical protein